MGLPGEARRAPGVEVSAGAPRAEPADASGWMRTKRRYTLRPFARWQERSTPAFGRVSNGRGTNVNPDRRTGPMTKDQRQLRRFGPRCLRRAISNPQRQPSLVGDRRESESSLGSDPGNRDHAPRFLWRETLEKPDNATIITGPKPGWYPLRGATPESFNRVHENFNKS